MTQEPFVFESEEMDLLFFLIIRLYKQLQDYILYMFYILILLTGNFVSF